MDYTNFIEAVKEGITDIAEEGTEVKLINILKNNSVSLEGIVISKDGQNISPTVYLNFYYEAYRHGKEIEEIIMEIWNTYEESTLNENLNMDFFLDFEKMKERVVCKLINFEKNKTLLEKIPYVRFLDLAVVFYCILQSKELGNATIQIYNSHLNLWKISVDELYIHARKNTRNQLGFELKSMDEVMEESVREDLKCKFEEAAEKEKKIDLESASLEQYVQNVVDTMKSVNPMLPMYVLTNHRKLNGAACLLETDILREFAKKIGQGFFIIPSSIHEVILVPEQIEKNKDHLNEMVKEVNATQVEAEEILSDQVYFYSDVSHTINF